MRRWIPPDERNRRKPLRTGKSVSRGPGGSGSKGAKPSSGRRNGPSRRSWRSTRTWLNPTSSKRISPGSLPAGVKRRPKSFSKEWLERCQESGLAPFQKLAKRLKRWADEILAYFLYPITNGIEEGINNKIKVLKRRSYGFHDMEYFFLKIMSCTGAFPSVLEVTHTNEE